MRRWGLSRRVVGREAHHEPRAALPGGLPPKDILRSRIEHPVPRDMEVPGFTPGDTYGLDVNKTMFYEPVARDQHGGVFRELFEGCPPDDVVPPATVSKLCAMHNVAPGRVVRALRDARMDMNAALHQLELEGVAMPYGSYVVVAVESYVPEAYAAVAVVCPSFEATQDERVLNDIHEVVLSAAELPLDTPRRDVLAKVLRWTCDDGTSIAAVLDRHGLAIVDALLLPHGEYAAQGHFVLQPHTNFPNIGVAMAATCLDFRTGLHNRFRFHADRMCDSIAEHIVRESCHMSQCVHLLRQAFWFNPEYSVEQAIRYKERLLQPSAAVFEMRYARMAHPAWGLPSIRNVVELEQLKILQHRFQKSFEDYVGVSNFATTGCSDLVSLSSMGGPGAGNYLHGGYGEYEARTAACRQAFDPDKRNMHGDYIFGRYYRDNLH